MLGRVVLCCVVLWNSSCVVACCVVLNFVLVFCVVLWGGLACFLVYC